MYTQLLIGLAVGAVIGLAAGFYGRSVLGKVRDGQPVLAWLLRDAAEYAIKAVEQITGAPPEDSAERKQWNKEKLDMAIDFATDYLKTCGLDLQKYPAIYSVIEMVIEASIKEIKRQLSNPTPVE